MNLGPTDGPRSVSPASIDSGRSSPAPRPPRVVEGGLHKSDKSLRKYAASIERALSTWEISPQEWADYIAFLTRLLKAIHLHPKETPTLPHSATVASKLAQCLNPALPSGVHQKALEVYTYVFATVGEEWLSQHLQEYLPGLSSVLTFASLAVRPAFYALYDDYLVKLSSATLRPALKSILLSLLPGVEDENGEDFNRCMAILETLQNKFAEARPGTSDPQDSAGYFWQCLFLCVVTSPSKRQGALSFLTRKLPKLSSARGDDGLLTDAEALISPEPGLLIRCFVAGLSDPQMLIQRGYLDLLVTHLPLHSSVLQQHVGSGDLCKLISASITVLLRRDMGLNRRLWTWFLGPDAKEEVETGTDPSSPVSPLGQPGDTSTKYAQFRYFSRYGKEPLERSVLDMFAHDIPNARQRAHPFRICLSLMDRWEIGGVLVPAVFLPAMQCAFKYSNAAAPADVSEIMRSVSLFFDGVEASLIWAKLLGLIQAAMEQGDGAINKELLGFFKWIARDFNITDDEMTTSHVPNVLLYVLSNLTGRQQANAGENEGSRLAMSIASILMDALSPRAFEFSKKFPRTVELEDASAESVQRLILEFYANEDQRSDCAKILLEPELLAELILQHLGLFVITCLEKSPHQMFIRSTALLTYLLAMLPQEKQPRLREICAAILTSTSEIVARSPTLNLPAISSVIGVLATIDASNEPSGASLSELEPHLSQQIWQHLSPMRPKYHVEASRCLWQLAEHITDEDGITASLLDLVRKRQHPASASEVTSSAQHFFVLWNYSASAFASPGLNKGQELLRRASAMSIDVKQASRRRDTLAEPLILLLDSLEDQAQPDFESVKSWLLRLPSLEHVLDVVLQQLKGQSVGVAESAVNAGFQQRAANERLRDLEHTFGMLRNILVYGNDWTLQCLSSMWPGEDLHGLNFVANACVQTLLEHDGPPRRLDAILLSVLDVLISSPPTAELKALSLDSVLIEKLRAHIPEPNGSLQPALLRLISRAVRLRLTSPRAESETFEQTRRSMSMKRTSVTAVRPNPSVTSLVTSPSPPSQLLPCIRAGFAARSARIHIEDWVAFLADVLPTFGDALFSGLIPLVEALCSELESEFDILLGLAANSYDEAVAAPDATISGLLEALEMVLARAHECLLGEVMAETPAQVISPQRNTFLGNVASGMFRADGPPSKTTQANSRLTVIIAFQDAIKISTKIWAWASPNTETPGYDPTSAATVSHRALRLRSKTRHLLEQIFGAEPLESLEVLIAIWCNTAASGDRKTTINLLQAMQDSGPRNIIPAVLDALCSRTNPSALPIARVSSQVVDLSARDVAMFFVSYLGSVEDDAMDEVWSDCIAFLRDVVANPLPYRAILPALLAILRLLAEKIGNTNFGEQRKMRRELGDAFQRLLAATFTTLPTALMTEPLVGEPSVIETSGQAMNTSDRALSLSQVLIQVVPNLHMIVDTPDKVLVVANSISSNLIGPLLHSKGFPRNVSADALTLLLEVIKTAPTAKLWKKEIAEVFNGPRLFASPIDLVEGYWLPIIRQWSLHEKGFSEVLPRLAPPSSSGIMFGVGANAARLDADRKTQLNLRRLCVLLLASPEDAQAVHLRSTEEKLVELFEASPSSAPSSAIRAELFMLLRALILSTSAVHLAPMWPIINDNLQSALASLLSATTSENSYNNLALLQACKLLDQLIILLPDDFQLHQWLYITDTIDAVYQPEDFTPAALADHVAEALGSGDINNSQDLIPEVEVNGSSKSHSRLLANLGLSMDKGDIKALTREDFARAVVRPFLTQLSIHAYERTYAMTGPDVAVCKDDLLRDLFDLSTLIIE